MTDRLTQLQDCLDDLLTQMYASLNYVFQRHPYGDIPDQMSRAPEPTTNPTLSSSAAAGANDGEPPPLAGFPNNNTQPSNGDRPFPLEGGIGGSMEDQGTPPPDPPETFHATLRELAQDLILKEQQIEHLINSLPGIGNSEADQEARMRELEAELKVVEAERAKKEEERLVLVGVLGEVVGRVRRVA